MNKILKIPSELHLVSWAAARVAAAMCGVLVPVAGWMMLIIGHYLFIYLYPTQISSGHTDTQKQEPW